ISAIGTLAVGGTTLATDERRQELTVISDAGRTLWRGPLQAVKESVAGSGQAGDDCPLLAGGDLVAEALIRLAPIDAWRQSARRYDYEQITGPTATLADGELAGKIVLIGDARAGRDRFRVLYGFASEFRHGVELHADIVNNLLQGVRVRGLDPLLQMLAMVVLAAVGGWLRLFKPGMRPLWRRLLVVGCLLLYLSLSVLIYVQVGVLLNTAYLVGAFLLTYWLLGKLTATAASTAA
ncbi:MAG: CHASE2 domain-containing protein, partial [Propionivibrio sp.]